MYLAFAGLFVISLLNLNATWAATTAGNDIKAWLMLAGWAAVLVGSAIVLWFERANWRRLA